MLHCNIITNYFQVSCKEPPTLRKRGLWKQRAALIATSDNLVTKKSPYIDNRDKYYTLYEGIPRMGHTLIAQQGETMESQQQVLRSPRGQSALFVVLRLQAGEHVVTARRDLRSGHAGYARFERFLDDIAAERKLPSLTVETGGALGWDDRILVTHRANCMPAYNTDRLREQLRAAITADGRREMEIVFDPSPQDVGEWRLPSHPICPTDPIVYEAKPVIPRGEPQPISDQEIQSALPDSQVRRILRPAETDWFAAVHRSYTGSNGGAFSDVQMLWKDRTGTVQTALAGCGGSLSRPFTLCMPKLQNETIVVSWVVDRDTSPWMEKIVYLDDLGQ